MTRDSIPATSDRSQSPYPLVGLRRSLARIEERQTASLSGVFVDPDGDTLSISATSSAIEYVTVSVSGGEVRFTGRKAGSATITVTARDPGGLSAQVRFVVTVSTSTTPPRNGGTNLFAKHCIRFERKGQVGSLKDPDKYGFRNICNRKVIVNWCTVSGASRLWHRCVGEGYEAATTLDPHEIAWSYNPIIGEDDERRYTYGVHYAACYWHHHAVAAEFNGVIPTKYRCR